MDPAKLKVVELRAELTKRGLDSKGNKPVLVERLRQALEEEKPGGKAPSVTSQKSEHGTDTEEEDSTEKSEPAKRPPRTPSRSSRHTSREPTTPAKTPTRRSSSRSSLSRQSPAKTTLAETNETVSTLEPVIEEENTSPKKENVDSTKVEAAPTTPKKEAPTTPKKEAELSTPKKDEAPAVTPKKETVCTTPKKETVAQNESPKQKKDETPEVVKTETKPAVDDVCKKTPEKANAQSPVKSETASPTVPVVQSPTKSTAQSPAKSVTQSPAKSPAQSPVKPAAESPSKQVVQSPAKSVSESPVKPATQSPVKPVTQSPVKQTTPSPAKTTTPQKVEQSPGKNVKESPAKTSPTDDSEPMQTETNVVEPEDENAEARKSVEEPMEAEEEDEAKESDDQDKDQKTDDKSTDRGKRKRSPSPQEEVARAPPIARPENEPTFDESAVLLSWYDSDLNLVINPTNYFSASPMQGDGFNFMWAGARASYGFTKGRVFYEARVVSEFDNMAAAAAVAAVDADGGAIPVDDEKVPSLLRIGWSTSDTSLQLGEEPNSYGYEGTGKKCTNKEFVKYGKSFGKDDVIGCYADFESEDGNVTLSYTVNGESQGPAFVFSKNELEDKPLFPHILNRNCSVTVNFGQEEHWSKEVLDGYTFVGKTDLNDRIAGPRRPEKREECEVILLCGLPFSGKTTWALKHSAENLQKKYSVLGTHNLIERMSVEGVPLKDNFKGRWENVVEKCSRALAKLLESAPSRRRNYILDQQANVYGSAQKRKMRNFYGFHRKAVIIVPSDEEFKTRIDKRKETDGVEIRESSILEVKANFNAPTVGESFEEVEWAELGEEEGKKLIETYNIEGKTAGYGQSPQQQNKRSRFDNGQKDRNNRDNRDHRRSGYNDRRGSGAWRGGPGGGGGWRDGGRMRGSPMRHGGGYGPPAWRGRGGAPVPPAARSGSRGGSSGGGSSNDRRQGGDRNRSGGSHRSGWNTMGYQGNHGGSGVWSGQGNWQNQSQSGWANQSSGVWGQSGQQQAWGGAAGSWKGYSQNNYGQPASGYGQSASSGYGNGNWNNWTPQYYNQYWGGSGNQQQHQQQTTGQTTGQTNSGGGGQAVSKK